jgi:hypothetical protein
VGADSSVLHLFLINSIGGTTVVLLLETEPGVVELPRLAIPPEELEHEDALRRRVRDATGIEVEISGFLDAPADAALHPEGGRILLARVVSGSPNLTLPHVGWEWTPGATLVTLPFAPKVMVDELKSFMNV